MWGSANLAFSLCPLLTAGRHRGSLGPWLAGDSRSSICPRSSPALDRHDEPDRAPGRLRPGRAHRPAERAGDHYRITGPEDLHHLWRSRSGGEHHPSGAGAHARCTARLARHLAVLVPKRMVSPPRRHRPANDLRCVCLERKLGIHASPTCVMAFGDEEGAIGYLVGEENRGLEYMFTMMNNARLSTRGAGPRDRRTRLPGRRATTRGPGCRAACRCRDAPARPSSAIPMCAGC